MSRRNGPKGDGDPAVGWKEYPRIEAREYLAYCRSARKYRDPGFRRWVCLMQWEVLAEGGTTRIATVPYFLSMGNKEEPYASKRSMILTAIQQSENLLPHDFRRMKGNAMARKDADAALVRTTVRLPKSLLNAAKHRGIDDGQTLQQVVIHALEHYLGQKGDR